MKVYIETPVDKKEINSLQIGDFAFISGTIYTARDAAHKRMQEALEKGDLKAFAELMNIHWEYKKKRSKGMSNSQIDEWYTLAMENGAIGGKMIGAGGGGFLMFYTEDKVRLRKAMSKTGMTEVRFRFEMEGAKIL